MKKKIILVFLLIIFNLNFAYANNFEYPDANLLKYDDYEVNFTMLYKDKINENVKLSDNLVNDDKIIDYVINFNYDLNAYNNKFFSAYIINELAMKVEKNVLSLSKNTKAINFISSHEFSNDFSDNGVKNKVLLQFSC